MKVRLGTRSSLLARTQSGTVADALRAQGADVEVVLIETAGDKDRSSAFADVGTAGIFVREIQQALLDGRIDVAVHSYKDLPAEGPAGLALGAVPERQDVRDRLLVRAAKHAPDAPGLPLVEGARVGTSAARRSALLADARPDLALLPLRGNVPTRIERLCGHAYDAIVLAAAGLNRLATAKGSSLLENMARHGLVAVDLDPAHFVPAPSQGALALEHRADDLGTQQVLDALDHPPSSRCVHVERALLAQMQAGCQVAFGAWATEAEAGHITLRGMLAQDGVVHRTSFRGKDPQQVVDLCYTALRDGLGDGLGKGASRRDP